LRSLDAIHLAAAIAVGADSLLTYDDRLASSAAAVGLNVLAPVA
jgi:predicted nucleic acid-binding protein